MGKIQPGGKPEMSPSLEGRVAVVTGGTGALGRAVVERLVELGARAVVPWRSRTGVEELSDLLGEGMTRVGLLEADLTEPGDVARLFQVVREEEGGLDALCNLAGGFAFGSIEDTDAEIWRRMIDTNATTAFLCTRHALPLLREAGAGRVVNVASMPALDGAQEMSAYAAAKAAVLNLTRSLSEELMGDRITVNAVLPEIIDTPQNRADMPDADTSTWLAPREIGQVIAWLLSDDASIVTGTAVRLSRR